MKTSMKTDAALGCEGSCPLPTPPRDAKRMTHSSVRLTALALLSCAAALDNGLALTPPLGWRSYNAFGGRIDQLTMVTMMKAMVDRSRSVGGKPTSLLDLGYNRVGLDGGWNECFPENHTFHWESDGRPVWNDGFPDPKAMVAEAHALGLLPGWYLNNCGCAENQLDAEMADKVMRGSVRMLAAQGWDGVKFDSCSQMHNLTRWEELLNATGRPVLVENCHQGAYTPGMRQWQGYLKSASGSGYTHFLGMFFGMAAATPLHNVSFAACRARCDALGGGCGGFTFESDEAAPASALGACYVQPSPHPNHMDMSNAHPCSGDSSPSDCPFHVYRVSGDISASWRSVLANLAYTRPFLGEGGLHPPYPPPDGVARSRPGGWAYPYVAEPPRNPRTHRRARVAKSRASSTPSAPARGSSVRAQTPALHGRVVPGTCSRWATSRTPPRTARTLRCGPSSPRRSSSRSTSPTRAAWTALGPSSPTRA